MAAVDVENLVVKYGSVVAVDDVSFGAEFGEVTAVIGPNGAGKTSTIETCEGFRVPTAGTVRVLGLDPHADRVGLHREVGVMLQEGGVYPSARVSETIAQYCSLYGQGVNPDDLIERVGLSHRATATWRRLSGGEKQRLSLALALASNPRVAFLDEPTSGVDVNGRDEIRTIITNLAANGTAVILATHELDEAERLADRVIFFDEGKIVANGTLAALRGAQTVVRFRSAAHLDHGVLSRHIGLPVSAADDLFSVSFVASDSTMSGDLVSRISLWLGDNSLPLYDLNVGAQRLEDVFRMLTRGGGR